LQASDALVLTGADALNFWTDDKRFRKEIELTVRFPDRADRRSIRQSQRGPPSDFTGRGGFAYDVNRTSSTLRGAAVSGWRFATQ